MRKRKLRVRSRRQSIAFTVAGSVVGLASVVSIIAGIAHDRSDILFRLVAILAGFAGFFATRALLDAGYEGDHPDRFGDGGGTGPTTHGIDTLAE